MVLLSGRRKYSDQDLAIFHKLETHIRDIHEKNKDQWNRISLSAKAVKEYSGTDMKEKVISAFGAKVNMSEP